MSDKKCPARLTWGLAIATKDRGEELCLCVEKALAQTRLPHEIVIVDASENWEANAVLLRDVVGDRAKLVVLPARLPSSSEQRNQAIEASTAEILFMIDDDSFMFPDCAERLMAVYEADGNGEIVGAQATLAAAMPGSGDLIAPATESRSGKAAARWKFRWLWRNVFLMGSEQIFLPYSESYPDRPVPASVTHYPVAAERLFHGARMTFRRDAIAKVRFDSLLRYYAPFEDLDASHRASHLGALVTVGDARLYHHMSTTNRLQRFRVTWLSMLNQAVLLKRHADDPAPTHRRYNRLIARRIFAEFLKDSLARRFDFPQFRGAINALRDSKRVFAMSPADLEAWYPEHQSKILNS